MTEDRSFVPGDVVSIPSGPRRDLGKPHNVLVVAVDAGEALVVPICTITGTSRDVRLVVTSADLDVLRVRSYPVLTSAKKVRISVLLDYAREARRRTKGNPTGLREATDASRQVAIAVARLLRTTEGASPFVLEFLRRTT